MYKLNIDSLPSALQERAYYSTRPIGVEELMRAESLDNFLLRIAPSDVLDKYFERQCELDKTDQALLLKVDDLFSFYLHELRGRYTLFSVYFPTNDVIPEFSTRDLDEFYRVSQEKLLEAIKDSFE